MSRDASRTAHPVLQKTHQPGKLRPELSQKRIIGKDVQALLAVANSRGLEQRPDYERAGGER
jgi:hypothetical protein